MACRDCRTSSCDGMTNNFDWIWRRGWLLMTVHGLLNKYTCDSYSRVLMLDCVCGLFPGAQDLMSNVSKRMVMYIRGLYIIIDNHWQLVHQHSLALLCRCRADFSFSLGNHIDMASCDLSTNQRASAKGHEHANQSRDRSIELSNYTSRAAKNRNYSLPQELETSSFQGYPWISWMLMVKE